MAQLYSDGSCVVVRAWWDNENETDCLVQRYSASRVIGEAGYYIVQPLGGKLHSRMVKEDLVLRATSWQPPSPARTSPVDGMEYYAALRFVRESTDCTALANAIEYDCRWAVRAAGSEGLPPAAGRDP